MDGRGRQEADVAVRKFPNLRLSNQLCFALYSATNAIVRFYSHRLSAVGLTYPQYLVLIVLWEHDGIAVRRLAQILSLDSSTLTPILKRLQQAGFIERRRGPEDERVVRLFLAERAFKVQREVAQIQRKVACQTGLPTGDFVEMRDRLHALVRAMNGEERAHRAA
jgi:DNA-binding MarR family transcriptional regulator